MMKLYQMEGCPFSAKVRRYLNAHAIPFTAIPVDKLGSERKEVLALEGVKSPEVPVLVDGDTVIQDSEAIIEYLRQSLPEGHFGDPAYGLTRTLAMPYSDAVPKVKQALGKEGFGVLTEIDVKATMKAKLDVDFKNYIILGACNPPLAYQALSGEPAIGLLLPCNVVVTEDEAGHAIVSAIDPRAMFSVVNQPGMDETVKEVGDRLRRVLANIE